jgi:hypothetical protein
MQDQPTTLNDELEAAIDIFMEEQMEKHGGLGLADYLRIREEARKILAESMGAQ